MSLLEVRDLSISFPSEAGRSDVVQHANFVIDKGETLAIVGESGCGKTVTALSILRLLPPQGIINQGEIRFCGRDLLAMSQNEIRQYRGREIAMIFQEPMSSFNPVFTIGAQIQNAIQLHNGVSRRHARGRALELLELVGIPDPKRRLDAYPHQMSGGMLQRSMIAVALATHPKLLIADEPTTALDVTIQAQIVELLRHLRQKMDMSVLLITHNFGLVNELADRVVVMYAGKVVETGTCVEILEVPYHPYTQSLIHTIPSQESRGSRLPELHGCVPAPGEWPKGCRFASRCQSVMSVCWKTDPKILMLSPTHYVSCHAVEQEKAR